MAKFLNTEKLLIQIPNLIKSSNNELVIIVPFISLSKSIEEALLTADKKDIETIIICRYSEVKQKDRQFLNSLNNINLFSHPNVHSKCYYNENEIIIGSLNLTAFSERNNREMGVYLKKYDEQEDFFYEFEDIFNSFENDLKIEIQELINSSELLIKSKKTKSLGFSNSLILTEKEKLKIQCEKINSYFNPKRFIVEEFEHFDYIICQNFFDKITLRIKSLNERIEFEPNKGNLANWQAKFYPLHKKTTTISFKEYSYSFTTYVNNGAKINIVSSLYDLDEHEQIEIWQLFLNKISNFFNVELLKI